MPISSLPLEVTDLIVDELAHDRDRDQDDLNDLIAISLVSKRFTRRAQRHIFSLLSFTIKEGEADRLKSVIDLLQLKRYANHVRILYFVALEFEYVDRLIAGWNALYPLMLEILALAKKLDELSLRLPHHETWPPEFEERLCSAPVELLAASPTITAFNIGNFFDTDPLTITAPPKLEYMEVKAADGFLNALVDGIRDCEAENNLSHLVNFSATFTTGEGIIAAWTVIAYSVSSLTYLELDFCTYAAFALVDDLFDPIPLKEELPSLENLHITLNPESLESCCKFLGKHFRRDTKLSVVELLVTHDMGEVDPDEVLAMAVWDDIIDIINSWDIKCKARVGVKTEEDEWEKTDLVPNK